MTAVMWVGIGMGGWTLLSLPVALLLAAMIDHGPRVPGADLPVIAEEDRLPAPPHLREPLLQR